MAPCEHEERSMTSESLHEPRACLPPESLDQHQASVSPREELDAVDWYDQRAADEGSLDIGNLRDS